MKKLIVISVYFISLFLSFAAADVKSSTGSIKFDTQSDGQAEMILNSIGLGIGTQPSSNLHVQGNAIISEQLIIGGLAGSSNLTINGSFGVGFESVSSNTILNQNSYILADSSSDNLTLTLPYAGNVNGRTYTIKKTSALNNIWIVTSDNLIDDSSIIELPSTTDTLPSVKLISNGSNWYVLESMNLSETIASSNLVGWWKLDETTGTTAYDSSGFNRHGTLNGSTFSSNSISGKVSRALYFDGVDDDIDIGTNDFVGYGNYTISTWYKSSDTSRGPIIESYQTGGIAVNVNRACVSQSSGDLSFVGSQTGVTCFATTVGASLNDDNWHLITFVRDSDTTGVVYFDDTVINSGALQSGNHQKGTLEIGSDGGGTNLFTGALDDIKVYNKALTPDEVHALYLNR